MKKKKTLKQRILNEMVIPPIIRIGKPKKKLGELIMDLIIWVYEGYKNEDDEEAFEKAREVMNEINKFSPHSL